MPSKELPLLILKDRCPVINFIVGGGGGGGGGGGEDGKVLSEL